MFGVEFANLSTKELGRLANLPNLLGLQGHSIRLELAENYSSRYVLFDANCGVTCRDINQYASDLVPLHEVRNQYAEQRSAPWGTDSSISEDRVRYGPVLLCHR